MGIAGIVGVVGAFIYGIVVILAGIMIADMVKNPVSFGSWRPKSAEPEVIDAELMPMITPLTSVYDSWSVRKQEDGNGYSVLPLLAGRPLWDRTQAENIADPVEAWDIANSLTREASLKAIEGGPHA